jgi:phage shock protein E
VPGSINIQHDTIQNHINELQNAGQVIVFCRSGNRSGQAKATLEGLGFTNVTNGDTWQDVLAYVKKQ